MPELTVDRVETGVRRNWRSLVVAGGKETVTVSTPPLVETQPSAVSALVTSGRLGFASLGRRYRSPYWRRV
jgi:hypothetical protein